MSAQTEALASAVDAMLTKFTDAKAGANGSVALKEQIATLQGQLDEANQFMEAAVAKLNGADSVQ